MATPMTGDEFPWADLLAGGELQNLNLVFAGPNDTTRLAQLLFLVLVNAVNAEGGQLFRHALVLLPPDMPDTVAVDVAAQMLRKRGTAMDTEELDILSRRLIVRRAESFDAHVVVDAVASAPKASFVVIVDAARYRPANWEIARAKSMQVPEDRWLSPLTDLARECIPRVPESVCVLLDVGEYLPNLARNREVFEGMDCTVWGAEDPRAVDDKMIGRLDEWVGRVERGDIVSVLAEIDSQDRLAASAKELCKVQVLYKGGRASRALELLRPLNTDSAPTDLKLKLATVAMAAEDPDLARRLLESSAGGLRELDTNELALELSQSLNSPPIARQTSDWLARHFPGSVVLRAQQLRRMLQAARDSVAFQSMGSTAIPLDDYATFVTQPLAQPEVPNYVEHAAAVDARWPQQASESRLAMALNARARQLPLHALSLAIQTDPTSSFARNAVNAVLWSIEQLLLAHDDATKEALSEAVVFMLHYLAITPEDTVSRERLDEVLSVDISGSVGVALLAYSLLKLAGLPQQAAEPPDIDTAIPDEAQMNAFLSGALAWLSSRRAVDLASTALPAHLMTVSADAALRHLKQVVHYMIEKETLDDTHTLRISAIAAFAIAPHATRKNDDLEILRLANSRLVLSGEAQLARDLAEAGLAASHGRPERLRLAWYAYGDVHHRSRNRYRALMYFGCALATQAPIELEQAYYEAMGIFRALRDTGLLAEAEHVLESCEQLLKQLGVFEKNGHRIETMRVGLRLHGLNTTRSADPEAWSELLRVADRNLQAVQKANDELGPILVMAAQILGHLESLEAPVDASIRARIEAAGGGAGEITSGLVRLAINAAPGPDQLLALTHAIQRTRYADDVGFDVKWLVRAARAQLEDAGTLENPLLASFSAELTTDHALSLPGEAQGGWLPARVQDPAETMLAISRQGIRVELLAADADERLVRVSAKAGELTVAREADAFSMQRLHHWASRFPYDYGLDEEQLREAGRDWDPNVFYNSMQGLGLSRSVGNRVLFVLDTQLQRLPPQLLLVADEPIGRNAHVAVAPSLTWLNAAINAPRKTYGPATAWISTTADNVANATLAMVADRIGEDLEHHGVSLSTAAQVPEELRNASLAIVAAHGSLADENRFFQRVSDEAKFRVSGLALASALEGAGVVVLFVCSGGRQDEHPVASTTVGLPKVLLQGGTLAVIASPWPLDPRVPSHWLPGFLAAWEAGETLLGANGAGNRRVESQMGDDAKNSMAMTLYGNPLLRRQDFSSSPRIAISSSSET